MFAVNTTIRQHVAGFGNPVAKVRPPSDTHFQRQHTRQFSLSSLRPTLNPRVEKLFHARGLFSQVVDLFLRGFRTTRPGSSFHQAKKINICGFLIPERTPSSCGVFGSCQSALAPRSILNKIASCALAKCLLCWTKVERGC